MNRTITLRRIALRLLAPALLAALLVPAAAAQSGIQYRKVWEKKGGNDKVEGRLALETYDYYGVLEYADVSADVNIFGKDVESGVTAGLHQGSPFVEARLFNRTVLSRKTDHLEIDPIATASYTVSSTFFVGIVPVTVQVEMGISAGVSFGATHRGGGRFDLSFEPGVSAFAEASAGVGVRWASAGLSARMTFFDTTIDIDLRIDGNGVRGDATLRSKALHILLELYAEYGIHIAGNRKSLPLVEWSIGSFSKNLGSF